MLETERPPEADLRNVWTAEESVSRTRLRLHDFRCILKSLIFVTVVLKLINIDSESRNDL